MNLMDVTVESNGNTVFSKTKYFPGLYYLYKLKYTLLKIRYKN